MNSVDLFDLKKKKHNNDALHKFTYYRPKKVYYRPSYASHECLNSITQVEDSDRWIPQDPAGKISKIPSRLSILRQ